MKHLLLAVPLCLLLGNALAQTPLPSGALHTPSGAGSASVEQMGCANPAPYVDGTGYTNPPYTVSGPCGYAGFPYPGASGGSGSSNTVAGTSPGTSASTANPVQGVTGGVPLPVSGAFYQTTQPVSGTVGISGTVPVSGSFYQATQPVSGTIADSNSAAFQGVVSITPGAATTAQRSIGYICTTAGNVTLTLADSSTITLPIQTASGQFQTLPFAVTNVALGTGTAGMFWGLK